MTKPARKPLDGIPFERKVPVISSAPAVEPEVTAEAVPAEPVASPAKEREDGKVPVMVRMKPAERKLIRQIAIGLDTTVQSLLEDAISDIIRRHRGAMNL